MDRSATWTEPKEDSLLRRASSDFVNLSSPERFFSALSGCLFLVQGTRSNSWTRYVSLVLGGSLLHRAATGHCPLYEVLRINNSQANRNGVTSVRHGQGVKVTRSITINKPAEDLFRYWRNFENLPRFMKHLESVRAQDHKSHWVVKAPAGRTVEWDAEIHNEIENELIAWRSLENADVNNAGSVSFRTAPGGRGTEVKVVINYAPPGGTFGATIAKLWGEEPESQLEDSLRQFKQLMETGEILSTAGQPRGSSQ
jgi:uncharacterized membrane protein